MFLIVKYIYAFCGLFDLMPSLNAIELLPFVLATSMVTHASDVFLRNHSFLTWSRSQQLYCSHLPPFLINGQALVIVLFQ
jgi:hypothetical protein